MLLYIWANETIIPKPELRGFPEGIPLESPPFGVTNRRELVAIICPETFFFFFSAQHLPIDVK